MLDNTYPNIDFASLKMAVEDKSKLFLTEISEESIASFSKKIKLIAEGVFEQYIFSVCDLYTEGARKISDDSILEQFTDYNNGYQGLMFKWNESHPIELKKQEIQIPQELTASQNRKSPAVVISVGTGVAIGLFIFSNVWVALAAELLTLVLAYRQKVKCLKDVEKFNYEQKAYKIKVGYLKQELIIGLTEDIVKWLTIGKENSDVILKSYNL